jgi:uncharacterized protein
MAPISLPSLEECLSLIEAHGMLPNIREHSCLVREVAGFLGRALTAAGLELSLPLIETSALLHDLGKTPCLGTTRNHAEWGAQILIGLGYHEVAQIVREHVHLDVGFRDERPVREAEVVNYADKRVLHDQVVTLEERFVDLQERYGRTPEARVRIRTTEVKSQALEQQLFQPLALAPYDLLQLNHFRRESWERCASPSLPGANPPSGKSR